MNFISSIFIFIKNMFAEFLSIPFPLFNKFSTLGDFLLPIAIILFLTKLIGNFISKQISE